MKKKVLFIYNPRAGKGRIKKLLSDVIELFNKNSYEVIIYSTKGKKDAKKIVTECLKVQKYQYVVCSGGDGTLNEVVNGIMGSEYKPSIGYIPSGTTNDFAYSLKLPRNIMKAAQIVIDRPMFPCDIGSINDKFFVYTAAFGIFTDSSYQTPQSIKNMIGRIAYVVEGFKRLPNIKSYQMDITYEDTTISGSFIYGMITNSNSVGGFRGITGKKVLLNDGQFESIFIKTPHNLSDLQCIINDLTKGNLNCDLIISLPVKKITLQFEEAVPWTVDGEFGGDFQTVNIENCNQAISIASLLGTPSESIHAATTDIPG